jgi:hypothetical protein
MSTQANDTKVRPSAAWYILVVVLWLASIALAIFAFKPLYDIFNTGITEISNGQQIEVPADGITVYTSQDSSLATCQLVDAQGDATLIDAYNDNENFDIDPGDGPHVWALGSTPDGFPAGTYAIECERLGRATLAFGDRIDIVALGGRLLIGFLVAGVFGLAGLILLIVLLVKRHNSKSRIRQQQLAGGGGYGTYPTTYGQYGSQPGGYSQPGAFPPPSNYPPSTTSYPPPPPGETPTSETPPPPAYPPPDDDPRPT